MEKQKYILLLLGLMAFTFVFTLFGCGNVNSIDVQNIIPIAAMANKNIIEDCDGDVFKIYRQLETTMANQTYFVKGIGKANLSVGEPLTVYTTMDYSPDAFYMENVSCGAPILGMVNASFAKRICLKKDGAQWSGKISTCSGQKNTASIMNLNDHHTYHSWPSGLTAKPYSGQDYIQQFGREITDLFPYPVTPSTVADSSYTDREDGTYFISYVFATNAETTAGYRRQIKTISGQTLKKLHYAKIDVTFDQSAKVLNYHVSEKYSVKTMNASTANEVDFYYTYGDGVSVRSF